MNVNTMQLQINSDIDRLIGEQSQRKERKSEAKGNIDENDERDGSTSCLFRRNDC